LGLSARIVETGGCNENSRDGFTGDHTRRLCGVPGPAGLLPAGGRRILSVAMRRRMRHPWHGVHATIDKGLNQRELAIRGRRSMSKILSAAGARRCVWRAKLARRFMQRVIERRAQTCMVWSSVD
jgi:hypothetical protein